MIEVIVQLLRFFVEVFDEGVDVVLSPRTVEAALVQGRIQALAKLIRLMLDAVDDLFDFPVADSVRLIDDVACRPIATPARRDAVSRSQLLQVGAQRGPITLGALTERMASHECVYPRCATKDG